MTHQETVESFRVRARLRVANAEYHARVVASRFGLMSPEYAVAARIVQYEQQGLLATYSEAVTEAAQ